MRKTWVIAKREYLETIKTKAFFIGLIVAPILFSGSGIAISLLKDQVDVSDKKIAVLDHSGELAPKIVEAAEERNKTIFDEEGEKVKPEYIIDVVEPEKENIQEQRFKLSNLIQDKELHAFIEIGAHVVDLQGDSTERQIFFHGKNAALDDARSWIVYPLNSTLRSMRMAEAGVDEAMVNSVLTWIDVEPMGLVEKDDTGAVKDARRSSEIEAVLIPVFLGLLMYMMILMGALPQLQSIMEEKTQRIAEVMLGSVKPFEFMMGKLIGGVSVSLTGAVIYVLAGIGLINYFGYNEYVPYHAIPWFFAFIVFAIFLFGAINSALGSSCSDPKDAQSMTMPAILPVVFPIFVMFPVIKEPTTGFATWISLIPFFSPILLTTRIATPVGISAWEPWAGLFLIAITTLAVVWVSARIFRVGILMQGTPPKLSNMVKWVIKG